MTRFLVLISSLLFAPVVAMGQETQGKSLTDGGWISCNAFLRMDYEQKMFYLFGLRESWQIAAVGIRRHANSERIPGSLKVGMLGSANWLDAMIAHPNVSRGEIMKRTEIQCERPGDPSKKAAWQAWLDAINEVQQNETK